jgi:hypothetical protein
MKVSRLQEQFPPIPSQNSANNVTSADVLGNKTDTSAGNSLYSIGKNVPRIHQKTVALGSSPVTIAASSGDVYIEDFSIYVVAAITTITSVAIATDDANPSVLMTALEGAAAELGAIGNIVTATKGTSFILKNTKTIVATIVGADPLETGSLYVVVKYQPISAGASLS